MPKGDQAEVVDQIGTYLVEQVLKAVGNQKSPVVGEPWPKLSKNYAMEKKALVGNTDANMELNGTMLDSLTYKKTKKGIEVGFYGDQAWKADGHLKFSGKKNNTPKRRFLPGEGQEFKPAIQDEIDNIILDAQVSSAEFPKSELRDLETTEDIYSYFEDKLDLEDREAIRSAILRNPDLVNRLDGLDILDLL